MHTSRGGKGRSANLTRRLKGKRGSFAAVGKKKQETLVLRGKGRGGRVAGVGLDGSHPRLKHKAREVGVSGLSVERKEEELRRVGCFDPETVPARKGGRRKGETKTRTPVSRSGVWKAWET